MRRNLRNEFYPGYPNYAQKQIRHGVSMTLCQTAEATNHQHHKRSKTQAELGTEPCDKRLLAPRHVQEDRWKKDYLNDDDLQDLADALTDGYGASQGPNQSDDSKDDS
jgi:hypothetical protein